MRIISHNRGLSAPDASGDRVVRGRVFGLIRWNERCCIRVIMCVFVVLEMCSVICSEISMF